MGSPWRRTFGWPQRSSDKQSGDSGRESRALPKLFSAGEDNSWPIPGCLGGNFVYMLGVDEFHPEMLKALDIVRLLWLIHLTVAWRPKTIPVDW